ncbi:MAG TPA: ATP-dependent zinc metalloprotease FtsH [Acidimicrobiales bacterium]|nr:ATP-dependent zinc metalloprotease FtsH [Acidimicrobiales bacterium]
MKRPESTGQRIPGRPQRATPRQRLIAKIIAVSVVAGAATLAVQVSTSHGGRDTAKAITYTRAAKAIQSGQVRSVRLDDASRRARLVLRDGTAASAVYPDGSGQELADMARTADVALTAAPVRTPSPWSSIALAVLPAVLLLALFILFIGPRMGLKLKQAKPKRRPATVPDTRFTDVAGVDEAVAELAEVVDYLHNPERYVKAGAKVPKGFLLVGPPGTGKTLLARAVAGEAGVPFFSLAGSEFVETFVGVGASRVRQVFAAAREVAPAIVFIDEIDAVGKARTASPMGGGNEERENTLNQLLVEMDGFTASGLLVLAATNRSDVLDPALTRPGRFDRQVVVPAPDWAGRARILELYAKERTIDPDVDLTALARRTHGLTGADLAALVNEATLEATRQGSDAVTEEHLQSALATSMLGRERRSAVITERDRIITAWHEAGHAVAALMLPHAEDPVSITIVPRGGAGGVTWMSGSDNSFVTRSEALDRLVVAMGGRAAEELLLDGDFTQGAASDFAQATKLALAMVTEYGMSDLGPTCRAALMHHQGPNDAVMAAVDDLLAGAVDRARVLVGEHKRLMEALVSELLEDETVSGDRLVQLAAAEPPVTPADLAVV